MKTSASAHDFKKVIQKTDDFYLNLLGYTLEKTKLEQIDVKNWKNTITNLVLDPTCSGVYLPRNRTAIVPSGNLLSLFHEFYGHGLFCEQTQVGRKLVDLENQLLKEEEKNFKNSKFSIQELHKFREQKQIFQELKKIRRENLNKYEIFAIWTEYFLAEENKLSEMFEKKYNKLSERGKRKLEIVTQYSKQFGDIATFYEFGFARQPTKERTRKILKQLYGDRFENSRLILLSGSRKPFSDIDLFASSDYLPNIKNGWLDLVSFNEQDFERRISLFEVQVTHPVIRGELIHGKQDYLMALKTKLLTQPITEEAIRHNLQRAEANKNFASNTLNLEDKKKANSYYNTYLANALSLSEGKRILTKENLLEYLKKASVVLDEKQLQLEGGNKK